MLNRTFCTLALLFSTASSVLAQDGGKLAWRGKNENPMDVLSEAKAQGRPSLLFFTSLGCKYCRELSDGAFSNAEVVSASSGLVCIFVDCDWGKKNEELSDQFRVTGYPTVAFVDPSGKNLGRLEGRETPEVLQEIKNIVQRYPTGPAPAGAPSKPVYQEYSARVLAIAKSSSKSVLIFFYDQSPATDSVTRALLDPALREVRDRLIITQAEYRKGSPLSTRFDILRAPTLLLLDPSIEKPEEHPRGSISGSRGPRELVREFEELFGATPGAASKPTAGPQPSSGGSREQELSDDEVDRKFIQARLALAADAIKRGKKAKAIDILEDVLQSFPKHVLTKDVRSLLDELKK